MEVSLKSISRVDSISEVWQATTSIGGELFSFEVVIQRVQISDSHHDIVQIPDAFCRKVDLNGPILDRLHRIIRKWRTGQTVRLPVFLGDTEDWTYDPSDLSTS